MEPETAVAREMALFRINAAAENRGRDHRVQPDLPRPHRRRLAPLDHGRGDRDDREDRLLRADGPAARADRDGPHGRGRDRPLATGELTLSAPARDRPALLDSIERLAERAARRRRPPARSAPPSRSTPIDPCADRLRLAARRRPLVLLGGARPRRLRDRRRSAAPTRSSPAGAGRFADLRADTTAGSCATGSPTSPTTCRRAPGRSGSAGWPSPPTAPRLGPVGLAAAGAADAARAAARRASDGRHLLTLCALAGAGDDPAAVRARLAARLAALRERGAAAARPAPGGPVDGRLGRARRPATRTRSPRPSSRIRAGEVDKLVLAREVTRRRRPPRTPRRRSSAPCASSFGSCFCFCVGTPEAAFIGASPELLVRRSGGGRRDRRPRRLRPPQRRPGGRRPPRRAAAAQRQGPRTSTRSSPGGSRAGSRRSRSGSRRRPSRS